MGHHHHHHHHDCDHDHKHDHHHHHHHQKNYNRAFLIGIILNSIFVMIEGGFGVLSHSLALIADAGHNLSDVAGLALAWGAFYLTNKKPTAHFTFGLRKSSILSALLNSIILLLAVGMIIWESIHRMMNPIAVNSATMMTVAAIGIVINATTAMLFFKDKDHDLNIRGAYLHMAADALISLGVVISGFIISRTQWMWLDPIVSLGISFVIIWGTWSLLKDSLRMSMDAVPEHINPHAVKTYLQSLDDVVEVHDLHIWAMSTTENAMTAHLCTKSGQINNQLYSLVSSHLKEHFKIHHCTLQIEHLDPQFHCELKSEEVI